MGRISKCSICHLALKKDDKEPHSQSRKWLSPPNGSKGSGLNIQRGCNEITCGWTIEQKVSKTKGAKWKYIRDMDPASQWQECECQMKTEVSNSTDTDMKMICIYDITSYVEIGRRGITGPGAVHGNTFVFPLVRLLAVLNLQSPCVED